LERQKVSIEGRWKAFITGFATYWSARSGE